MFVYIIHPFNHQSLFHVRWPVQILHSKCYSKRLVFLLRGTRVSEFNSANFRRSPGKLPRHFVHRLSVHFDRLHEIDSFFHGELTQHFCDNAFLILMQFQEVASIGTEGAEQVENAKLFVQRLHHLRVLSLMLDEVNVPHIVDSSDA